MFFNGCLSVQTHSVDQLMRLVCEWQSQTCGVAVYLSMLHQCHVRTSVWQQKCGTSLWHSCTNCFVGQESQQSKLNLGVRNVPVALPARQLNVSMLNLHVIHYLKIHPSNLLSFLTATPNCLPAHYSLRLNDKRLHFFNLEVDFSVTEWFLKYLLREDFNNKKLHYFILFYSCRNKIILWY